MLSVFSGLSERQTVSEGETWKVNIGVNDMDGRTYKCVFPFFSLYSAQKFKGRIFFEGQQKNFPLSAVMFRVY